MAVTRFTPAGGWIAATVSSDAAPVDGDERHGRAARPVAPQREGRDINAGLAQQPGEAPDEAGFVFVRHIDHRRREFRSTAIAPTRNDARLAIMEHRARHRNLASRRCGAQRDERFIVGLDVARHLLDDDAALASR